MKNEKKAEKRSKRDREKSSKDERLTLTSLC